MNINNKEFKQIVKKSNSKSDVCEQVGLAINGRGIKLVNEKMLSLKLDISHFYKKNIKYKKCPVCIKEFKIKWKNQMTCSYSCSNTYFRSGENHPKWKDSRYRTTCFLYHKKECIICGENKIVAVHHYDGNNKNNKPDNLIPLCPTHHQYWHSRYRPELINEILKYIDDFKNKA